MTKTGALSILALISYQLLGNSIVYNFRIAETTQGFILSEGDDKAVMSTATAFGQVRTKQDDTRFMFFGGAGTFVYYASHYYARIDAAVARTIKRGNCFTYDARTRTDDILVTGGYGHEITDQSRITYSIIFGFPTHANRRFETIEFGYGHFALGPQIDTSYIFSNHPNMALTIAGRLIHFFPRIVPDRLNKPNGYSDFNGGDMIDIFLSYRFGGNHNKYEVGYDVTQFCNYLKDDERLPSYTRNNFFATYKRIFTVKGHPSSIVLGLSSGFDSKPDVGYKRLVTAWASWWVSF